jgi:hypothetical protein
MGQYDAGIHHTDAISVNNNRVEIHFCQVRVFNSDP